MTEFTEETCSWIDCPCLEVTMQVPVELDLVAECWEHTILSSGFPQVQRRIVEEMLRGTACGERTRRLGSPCGDCDRYREDHECEPYSIPPKKIFYSLASGLRAPVALYCLIAVLTAMLR